jgi:hypothetical protein
MSIVLTVGIPGPQGPPGPTGPGGGGGGGGGATGPTGPPGPGVPVITPEMFGAVGDGTTDDGPAINSAMASMTSGQTLQFFPNITYAIGAAGVVLSNKTNAVINLNGCTIKAIANGSQQTQEASFISFVKLSHCTSCSVSNGSFNPNGFTGAFIGLDTCTDSVITGNTSTNVSAIAHFFALSGIRNTWSLNYANGTAALNVHGFYMGGANAGEFETNVQVNGNKAHNLTATCFVLQSIGGTVTGNVADTTTNMGAGFIVPSSTFSSGSDITITGNTAINCSFHGFQHDPHGGVPTRISVIGNRFENNVGYGVFLVTGTNTTVMGNTLIGNGNGSFAINGGCSQIVISGNICDIGFVESSIAVVPTGSAVTDVTIDSNTFLTSATTGNVLFMTTVGATDLMQRVNVTNNKIKGGAVGIFMNPQTNGGTMEYINVIGNSCETPSNVGIAIQAGGTTNVGSFNITNNFSFGLAIHGGASNSLPNIKIIANSLGTYNASSINTNNSGATGWIDQFNSFD